MEKIAKRLKVRWTCPACKGTNRGDYTTCRSCAFTLSVHYLTPDPRSADPSPVMREARTFTR